MLPGWLLPAPEFVLVALGAFLVALGIAALVRARGPRLVGRLGVAALTIAVGVGVGVGAFVLRGWLHGHGFSPDDSFTLWSAGGLGVAAFALALGVWAWRGDRARGRKRCPRCWYDMSGAPGLLCPECGKNARTPKALLRPRRRWGAMLAAAALLLVAHGVHVVPRVREDGWVGAMPTWALIAGLPWWPEGAVLGGGGVEKWSLQGRRVVQDEPWKGWARMARWRAKGLFTDDASIDRLWRAHWFTFDGHNELAAPHRRAVALGSLRALRGADPRGYQLAAFMMFSTYSDDPRVLGEVREATPVLLAHLRGPDRNAANAAGNLLALAPDPSPAVLDDLLTIATGPPSANVAYATVALRAIARHSGPRAHVLASATAGDARRAEAALIALQQARDAQERAAMLGLVRGAPDGVAAQAASALLRGFSDDLEAIDAVVARVRATSGYSAIFNALFHAKGTTPALVECLAEYLGAADPSQPMIAARLISYQIVTMLNDSERVRLAEAVERALASPAIATPDPLNAGVAQRARDELRSALRSLRPPPPPSPGEG